MLLQRTVQGQARPGPAQPKKEREVRERWSHLLPPAVAVLQLSLLHSSPAADCDCESCWPPPASPPRRPPPPPRQSRPTSPLSAAASGLPLAHLGLALFFFLVPSHRRPAPSPAPPSHHRPPQRKTTRQAKQPALLSTY